MSKVLKSGPIVVACHWHTGSAVVAKVLAACGMVTGNENTYWDDLCEDQCEHGLLNRAGDQICLGNDYSRFPALIEETLENYVEQAKENKWKHYGVKITHILQETAFAVFEPIIKKVWPKARFVIVIRHPAEVLASIDNENWPEDRVLESLRSTYAATEKLVKAGALVVRYPDDLPDALLKKIVPALGLKATKAAEKIFDAEEKIFDTKLREAFAELHADDVDWFYGVGK